MRPLALAELVLELLDRLAGLLCRKWGLEKDRDRGGALTGWRRSSARLSSQEASLPAVAGKRRHAGRGVSRLGGARTDELVLLFRFEQRLLKGDVVVDALRQEPRPKRDTRAQLRA